jgi:hypothetical protein
MMRAGCTELLWPFAVIKVLASGAQSPLSKLPDEPKFGMSFSWNGCLPSYQFRKAGS